MVLDLVAGFHAPWIAGETALTPESRQSHTLSLPDQYSDYELCDNHASVGRFEMGESHLEQVSESEVSKQIFVELLDYIPYDQLCLQRSKVECQVVDVPGGAILEVVNDLYFSSCGHV